MGSKLYGVGKGKRKLISRSTFSARQNAAGLRAHIGAGKRGDRADLSRIRQWKPKRGRRKLGARRKVTLIQRIIRWIPVPKIRRRTRRR